MKRHGQVQQVLTRALAVVSGGGGHLYGGFPWRGLALLTALLFLGFLVWFWRGVMPPAAADAVPAGGQAGDRHPRRRIVVYVVAVRDLFRTTVV